MARHPRNETGPGIYHVWARGNRKLEIFLDDLDCQTYLVQLAMTVRDFGWRLLSYSLMVNHVHLLVETVKPNLGTGMRGLHGVYARMFNERHGFCNHLFGDRYGSKVIDDDDHLRRVARYIALNPVAAGITSLPGEYRWDSWPTRARGWDDPLVPLDLERLLEFFGSLEAYSEFVVASQ